MSIENQTLNYEVNGVNHICYLAKPSQKEKKYPAVIVVHEWWGLDEHAKERADQLAKEGCLAVAIDMYGESKVVDNPESAYNLSSTLLGDISLVQKKFSSLFELLKQRPDVDSNNISAIGYCFGGTVVLNMARAGMDLALVSSFHGALAPPLVSAQPGTVKTKVLVFNGEADPYVEKEHIESFKKEMSDLKVDYEFTNYPEAIHSFTNKKADENGKKFNLPLAYNASADKDSWSQFLKALSR